MRSINFMIVREFEIIEHKRDKWEDVKSYLKFDFDNDASESYD